MALMPNRKSPTPVAAGTDCCRGAMIGAANGVLLALLAGAHAPLAVFASAAGASAVGALIALLIWSASSGAPDDPVLPPRDDR